MNNRRFQVSEALYESIRLGLDVLFGHPNGHADTCLPPVAEAPRHEDLPVVCVLAEMCEWAGVAELLAELVGNGSAVELEGA